jgi:hypothetical protein
MHHNIMKMKYLAWTSEIMESYDYRDVKSAVKHAKDNVSMSRRPNSLSEMGQVLDRLFQVAVGYLQLNCTPIGKAK